MADRNPPFLRLDDFDVDGAVRGTFERMSQLTRSGFLRRTVGAGAAALGAVAVWSPAASAKAASSDITILNSSGVPPYDAAARRAIELSSPLKALPADFPNPTERVTCMFYYNMEIPRV